MSSPLSAFEASITRTNYGAGVVLDTLLLERCPACPPERRHAQVIPFSDAPCHKVRAGDREVLVWQRVSGSTVDDLTLAPSFLVPSCSLHGFVRAGRWEPC